MIEYVCYLSGCHGSKGFKEFRPLKPDRLSEHLSGILETTESLCFGVPVKFSLLKLKKKN